MESQGGNYCHFNQRLPFERVYTSQNYWTLAYRKQVIFHRVQFPTIPLWCYQTL